MKMIRKVLENGKVQVLHAEEKEKKKIETASVKPVETATMPDPEPKHVGGGYYELPNGERVKGKEAAEEALKG